MRSVDVYSDTSISQMRLCGPVGIPDRVAAKGERLIHPSSLRHFHHFRNWHVLTVWRGNRLLPLL
jgi:hypothetical protein